MKLKLRTLVLLGLLLALVAAGLIYIRVTQENLLRRVFLDYQNQSKAVFAKIFDLKEKPVESLDKDYTYWDELVAFTKTKNQKWAADNLDTSLATYNVSNLWVYGLDGDLIYQVGLRADSVTRTLSLPMTPDRIVGLFQRQRTVHFFVNSKEGVFDVFGATIHPSNDAARKTPPQGYFFAANLLSSSLLQEIGATTASSVSVEASVFADQKSDEVDVLAGKLVFFRALKDDRGQTIGFVRVDTVFQPIRELAVSVDRDFLILFVFGVGFLLTFFLVIYLQDRSVAQALKIAEVMTANLSESEARFRAMNDASPMGIFVADPKGKCIYTNAAYQKLSGQSSEQSWGDGWLEPIVPEQREQVYKDWYTATLAGVDFSSEHRLQTKAGVEKWVVVKANDIRLEDKLLGFVGVVEDITELKRQKQEVQTQTEELAIIKEKFNRSQENSNQSRRGKK